jgi:hypothetical protein
MSQDLETAQSAVTAKMIDSQTKMKIAELENSVKILLQKMNMSHEVGVESMRHIHDMVASSVEPAKQHNAPVQSPGANPENME